MQCGCLASLHFSLTNLHQLTYHFRLLNDVRYLKAKISALKGVGSTSGMGMLEIIVNEKRPTDATAPSRVASPPISSPGVTPVNPAPPPSSSPPPTSGIGIGLPPNVRRSPFAGNRRISSLLSSVTAIGKVVDQPETGKPLIPAERPIEKAPLVEDPESIPISASDSLGLLDKAVPQDDPAAHAHAEPAFVKSPQNRSTDIPALPSTPEEGAHIGSGSAQEENKAATPNGLDSTTISPPNSIPPAVPPKLNLNAHSPPSSPPPPTPNKELRTEYFSQSPSDPDPLADATSVVVPSS